MRADALDGPPSKLKWRRCRHCRKTSIVSYTLHRHLLVAVDGLDESKVPGMHEYYSRMCIGGELAMRFRQMNGI